MVCDSSGRILKRTCYIVHTVINGDIDYFERGGSAHFMIQTHGDDLQYVWKINGSMDLITSSTGNAITTDPIPPGMTHVSVNVSNQIDSDVQTILILNTSNTGTCCTFFSVVVK